LRLNPPFTPQNHRFVAFGLIQHTWFSILALFINQQRISDENSDEVSDQENFGVCRAWRCWMLDAGWSARPDAMPDAAVVL
jgi:hypothetical protein